MGKVEASKLLGFSKNGNPAKQKD